MRVRIQHGIDESNIPEKLKELISELSEMSDMHMNKINAAKALLYSIDNIGTVSSILESTRSSLVDLDQLLADVHSIAKGYADHLASVASPPPRVQQPTPQPAPTSPIPQDSEPPPPQRPKVVSRAPNGEAPPHPPSPSAATAGQSPRESKPVDDIITQMGQALSEKG